MFTSETIQAMKYLTDEQIQSEARVNERNMYVFASTKQSNSHASGWHCMNEILKCLDLKGAERCSQKPSSSCINVKQVTILKKRTRANISTFWSLRTYQQRSLSSPTRVYAAPNP